MSENKQYEKEYKVQAVKLAKKIGAVNAANELQIPVNTLYGWIRKVKIGSLDIGCGERSPEESLNIAEENQQLRQSGQMTAETAERSVFTATRCKSADRRFTIILDVRASHGSISRLLTLC